MQPNCPQMLVKRETRFHILLNGESQTYHITVTFSLETVKHHGLAAAAGGRPRGTNKHPDEGIRLGRAQALSQAEEVGRLATTYVSSPLITQQRWWR